MGCILYLISKGIGVWGLNKTVDWAWDITNFVWWVGIGHAGTLISAVLLLFRQKWRMAINRSAEAMTIFAVIMAATFPGIHMGRIWMAYWVFPLPNQFGSLWVNFNSPLLWDVFAISTYFSVSLVFWYIGLIPDFATIRDKVTKPGMKKMYGILSFGWTGNAKAWTRFEEVSLVLAGIATPLVFSVHSVVSMDFATSVIPGWHTTIFPPYFVSGAVFSGFAMVQTLLAGDAQGDAPGGLHHQEAHRVHEHRDHRHGFHRGCGVHHRVVHQLVQRCGVRELCLHQPRYRTILVGLLDHDDLQRDQSAAVLVQEVAHATWPSPSS